MGRSDDPVADAEARPLSPGERPSPDAGPGPALIGPAKESNRWVEVILPLVAAFALAVFVRCLAVGLPIEGDAVAYGALAHSLSNGHGYTIDGVAHDRYPPAHPALLALALAFGGTVTATSRWLGVLLAGAAASLLVSIGLRIGRGKCPILLLVVLSAAHPSFALFAGGLVPGSEVTGLVMLLGAMRWALVGSKRAQLAALALTGLLPLVRYDLVAFPIAALALIHKTAGGTGIRARVRSLGPPFALLLAPLLLWLARTWIVSGTPFGIGYAAHGFSLSRVPHNVLTLVALVLPAAGLGLLWIFVPTGLRRLWDAKKSDRPVVRTALIGAAIHLCLVALFAGPTYQGDGSLKLDSSGSLRFGLSTIPFIVLAAILGLGTKPDGLRRPVALVISALSIVLSGWLLGGGLQRATPFHVMAAGRLHLLAEAYDAAVLESATSDWIALELARRDGRHNAGVEVYIGDRAPSRRTGVIVAEPVPRGVFPSAPVLPLRDGLGGTVRCWLVSDLVYEGVIFTGERKDLGRGGQGIFQRIAWREISDGRAGSYTIHQVVRPPK